MLVVELSLRLPDTRLISHSFADAQLWSAAALMQTLRQILPIGYIWTPIMPALIQSIASLESDSIDKVRTAASQSADLSDRHYLLLPHNAC